MCALSSRAMFRFESELFRKPCTPVSIGESCTLRAMEIIPRPLLSLERCELIGRRKCALITLNEGVEEIEELAGSAGYEVVYEIIQRRARPEPGTYLGKGKVDEVLQALSKSKVDALIINGDLKPSHHYHLENTLKVECVDRIRLILEIFTLRANNKESKLQVERARLRYEVPLLREWIHSAKMGEHPGFLGGGEYAVDVYYDLINKRMRKIDEELQRIGTSSQQRREQRRRKGFHLISFAGYTNAGKSSLMRMLTGEEVVVEDRMFSTLSTTTKRIKGSSLPVLLTDTIGFLDDLPHFVIEAFKNTIDEIFTADLILLVLDCSENIVEMERKLRTSEEILFPDAEPDKMILVLNKIDRIESFDRMNMMIRMKERFPSSEIISTSAKTGEGVERLRIAILRRFSYSNLFEISLPQKGGTERLLTWARQEMEIFSVVYSNDVRVRGSCKDADLKKLAQEVSSLGGVISFSS